MPALSALSIRRDAVAIAVGQTRLNAARAQENGGGGTRRHSELDRPQPNPPGKRGRERRGRAQILRLHKPASFFTNLRRFIVLV
jgi:hypothetical protein